MPYIVGLGTACELAAAAHGGRDDPRGARCATGWRRGCWRRCPDARVNGDREHRLPNTTNISFEYIEGEAILYHLERPRHRRLVGSACTSGSLEPSHVIRAMGVPFTAAHGSIRFSLSRYNTEEEIDYVIEQCRPSSTGCARSRRSPENSCGRVWSGMPHEH